MIDPFITTYRVIERLQDEFQGKAPRQILLEELEENFGLDEENSNKVLNYLKNISRTIYEPKKGYYTTINPIQHISTKAEINEDLSGHKGLFLFNDGVRK